MKKKDGLKILMAAFKNVLLDKMLIVYFASVLIVSGIMTILEPTFETYRDGLWYCFVASTTIGFGDIVAQTVVCRILTVVMFIMTTLLLAVITAVFTQTCIEMMKSRKEEAVARFVYDLEHLPDLSKEELEALSKKIRDMRRQ